MEIYNLLFGVFEPEGFSYFIQILILIIQLIYVLFAFMLTRQIKIMNRNFKTGMSRFFSTATTIHFFASLGLVAFSVLTL